MRWETFDGESYGDGFSIIEPDTEPLPQDWITTAEQGEVSGLRQLRHTVSHRAETTENRAGAMLALLERPEWHEWAACRGMLDFFDLPEETQAARCAVCPVLDECQQAGAKADYGMWAGEVKPGLPPVVDELADRIVDAVTTRPYVLRMRDIEKAVPGKAVAKIRAKVKRLVADGLVTPYEVAVRTSRGATRAIVYGPGEARP